MEFRNSFLSIGWTLLLLLTAGISNAQEVPDVVYELHDSTVSSPFYDVVCIQDTMVDREIDSCTSIEVNRQIKEIINLPEDVVSGERAVRGVVLIEVVVDDEGRILAPRVIRGADPEVNDACLEAVARLEKMNPAQKEGEKVAVKYYLPIDLSLSTQ